MEWHDQTFSLVSHHRSVAEVARLCVAATVVIMWTSTLLFLLIGRAASTNPGCVPNCVGVTPPRGLRTWNSVRGAVNQSYMESLVLGLVAPLPTGATLQQAGFTDVGLDDGWEACGAGVSKECGT